MADLIHPHLLKTPETMNRSKISRILLWLVTGLALIGVSLAAKQPSWVETRYSTGMYPKIGRFLRGIMGKLPFSLGDIVYTMLIIALIIIAFRFIRQLIRRQLSRAILLKYLGRLVLAAAWGYILFYGVWGLNYYRQGIAQQLTLQIDSNYTKADLEALRCDLLADLSRLRRKISTDTLLPMPKGDLLLQAQVAYQKAEKLYPFLAYRNPSVKQSMFGAWGRYAGYLGYFNPLTGEANIRWNVPDMTKPFTICHEMAHQLGYASEDQANFVSYLVCMASDDPYFQYAALLDIYSYLLSELLFKDIEAYYLHGRQRMEEMDPLVLRDRRMIRQFFRGEENNLAPVISSIYHQYLLANDQLKGVNSYNDVVAWVLALRKRES
jgi:hypothetical protein